MNQIIRIICFLLLFCTNSSARLFAQDTTTTAKEVVIETKDGVTLTGTVLNEDNVQIVIKTNTLGTVTILRSNIKEVHEISGADIVKGEYWFENPNYTRYVIGPSAIPLRKREGYYQNLYVFVQSVNYGITDNISIGGGTEIASLLFAQEAPAFVFLTPKYGRKVAPKIHVGGGVLYIGFPAFSWLGSGNGMSHYGIAYGLCTYGNRNNNITLGVGWNFSSKFESIYSGNGNYVYERNNSLDAVPTITFSGMLRPGKRFGLVTENWIIPLKRNNYQYVPNAPPVVTTSFEYQVFFSYGARFMGEKISVDLGFFNSPEIAGDIIVGVPYIDFVVKFGGPKKVKKK